MDSRTWFLLQDRPAGYLGPDHGDIRILVRQFCPWSRYRCSEVMDVFMAGFRTGFKLTDEQGRPTDTLRLMVKLMEAELCQADGLSTLERRHFTDQKGGGLDPIFKDRWFIRNISSRLRYETAGATGYGWAWYMFKTQGHLGLMQKRRVTQVFDGVKRQAPLFLVVCPPDWELGQIVYEGLWKWTLAHWFPKAWDAYAYLDKATGVTEDHPAKGGTSADGHEGVVSA